VWKVAATVAVIASLETLLGIEATDRLDTWRRRSPPDRELLAQGIGNALSSALGGLPITAVIVRSSANIQAGARSRWSSVAHGGLLFVLVAAVPDLLNRIPLASLAAILIVVGYRLARVEVFREMYERGWVQFAPFIVTVVCTVLSDLLVGVCVGLAVGIVAVILTDHHTAITTVRDGDAWLIRFTRDATFLNKHTLRSTLDAIPAGSDVVIDGARIGFVDPDIQEVLEDFRSSAAWRDLRVTFQSLDGKVSTSLRSSH
jgi:MFS superfamily sulfate permease-like transporter